MIEMPPIPDFLIRRVGEPRTPWTPTVRKTTRKPKRRPFHLPANIEPAGLAMLKEIEREKKAKAKARKKKKRPTP
jgi:hypothetical protein